MDDHDALIASLSADAKPVKRPLAPGVRAFLWMLAVLPAGAFAVIALKRAFTEWSAPTAPWAVAELLAALVTGGLGIFSAFALTQPGRKVVGWPWFAAGSLVWGAAGLVSVSQAANPWGHVGSGTGCYLFMVTASLPMIVLSIVTLRRTRTLYPLRTLGLAGLGIAFMTATLMSLCHPPSGDMPDFLMHIVAGVTIVVMTVIFGRRWVAV